MGYQLTPEENKIIRETQRQGEELAKTQESEKNKARPLLNALKFIAIFVTMVFVGYMILIVVTK